jgi:hypothetical protein
MHHLAGLILLAGLLAANPALAGGAGTTSPRIFDVKLGLADFVKQQVYLETSHVTYHENGRCDVGSEQQPCLQWGIRFRFRDMEPGAVMQCRVGMTQASQPVVGLPESRTRTDYSWSYRFARAQGTAFVPQFTVRNPGEAGRREVAMRCTVGSGDALVLTFIVDMPQ